jgi:3-phenylpropionate/cinnamic acid dioxygenase small subunit
MGVSSLKTVTVYVGCVMSSQSGDPARVVENLLYSYAERMDAGDFAGVAALFDRATYGPAGGPMLSGCAELEAVLRSMVRLHGATPATKHVTTNVSVDIGHDGRSATARSYFTVLQALEDFPLQVIVAGRYHDRFVLDDGGWRFEERVVWMDLTGDLSRHLVGYLARSR